MIENKIIPTIFALDNSTFNKKLEALDFVSNIHLDFMDGKFTSRKTIPLSEMSLVLACPEIEFGLHLMAYDPIQYLSRIKWLGIKKVLIQYSVFDSDDDLISTIDKFKENNIEVYLVINPDIDAQKVLDFSDKIDGCMLMSVVPGAEGQAFIEGTYDKIKFLRENGFDKVIQIDGGINLDNCQRLKDLGANYLSVGSSISSSESPKDSYEKLLSLIKNQ